MDSGGSSCLGVDSRRQRNATLATQGISRAAGARRSRISFAAQLPSTFSVCWWPWVGQKHRRPAPADKLRRQRSRGEPFPCRPWFRFVGIGALPWFGSPESRQHRHCRLLVFARTSPGGCKRANAQPQRSEPTTGVLILPPPVDLLIVFCRDQVDARCRPRRAGVLCNQTRLLSPRPIPRPHAIRPWIESLFETRRWA